VAKVLFINPVVRQEDSPRHVPYGIAMLASIAIRDGHQVQVFDHNGWRLPDDTLRQALEADDWDVVAAGGITTAYNSLKTVFGYMAKYAPKALKVAGGGMLTSMPLEIMDLIPDIQVGVVGEAYLTFPELLTAVDAGVDSFVDIKGLVVRETDGRSLLTLPRGLLQDLDSLPYPAWELFPLEEVYFPNSGVAMAEESLAATRRLDINTSYGCSLICRYCFHLGLSGDMEYVEKDDGSTDVVFDVPKHHTRTIRYHSPRYIVDMVKYMVEKFDVNFVSFLDENLMTMDQYSKRTWMDEICDLWIAEGLKPVPDDKGGWSSGVYWGGTSHATLATEHILNKMGEAGCRYLDYGWESFSPQILKEVGKGATPANNKKSYHLTLSAGIRPIPNQMIGFPTEDFDSIRASMKAWDEMGIVAKPFFVTPYPGCEWFSLYRDKIMAQFEGNMDLYLSSLGDATDLSANICENFSDVELYGIRELMLRGDFRKLDQFEAQWRKNNGETADGVALARARTKSYPALKIKALEETVA
jgi:anaerobic magnesium-protoporphyrin IX monomethyl ester cyclase